MARRNLTKKQKDKKKRKRKVSWGDGDDTNGNAYDNVEGGAKKKFRETMLHQWKRRKTELKGRRIARENKVYSKKKSWIQGEDEEDEGIDNEEGDAVHEEDSSDDEAPVSKTFNAFLSVFQKSVDDENDEAENDSDGDAIEEDLDDDEENEKREEEVEGGEGDESDDNQDDDEIVVGEDSLEETHAKDPFRKYYVLQEELSASQSAEISSRSAKPTRVSEVSLEDSFPESVLVEFTGPEPLEWKQKWNPSQLFFRDRLINSWESNEIGFSGFSSLQKALLPTLCAYRDLLFTAQSLENKSELRSLYLMHVWNHLLKTRDTINKNNERARKQKQKNRDKSREEKNKIDDHHKDVDMDVEYRDQGFTRPSILILTPFRSTAKRIVEDLVGLKPNTISTVKGLDRFMEQYGSSEAELDEEKTERWKNKPEQWKDLFFGNNDDCFQLGISVSRKGLKFYSEYSRSDIILASPLGLRLKIGTEGDEKRDFDFLSSIEMVVMDQTDVFFMQNYQHVKEIFQVLNVLPKSANEDTDFSRLRAWNLADQAKYLRQTIVLSAWKDPALNHLLHRYCFNVRGTTRMSVPILDGTVSNVVLPHPVKQVFNRFRPMSLSSSHDDRFEHFRETICGSLRSQKHTMLFIPSYLDFVRVRNFFQSEEVSFVACHEYSSASEISRARSLFQQGRRNVLLYTERFHFFRRYQIQGVLHVMFYDLPQYATFYAEILNMIDQTASPSAGELASVDSSSIALFSKYGKTQLERVVGSKRAKHMLTGNKSTYMFC